VSVEVILQGLVSGLLMGFVYALIAAGLSLIFGLMEIVNFAHGEFLMLAMFATFWAWALARLDPLTSLPITVALLFLLGFAVYHGLIRWILGAPMLAQIFATFGLAIFLRAAAQCLGTRPLAKLWVGLAAQSAKPQLSVQVLQRARRIGERL
jgi:branched-chain amino acid transport system permease protein